MPSASIMQPMVLAVPITMQVPLVGASRPLTALDLGLVDVAGAILRPQPAAVGAGAQHLALVVADQHRPGRQHDRRDVGLAAPISCAGRVLSQPPISTTASIGWARTISSVSIAIRLRRNMRSGAQKLSWIEMVGNSIGMPPASITPRFTASIRSGTLPWHGLKSLKVSVMPMIGRSSASSV